MSSVSILVCCHNSARLLPQTLQHLAQQEFGSIPWEVVIVDNASSDGTAEVARQAWADCGKAPLRVVLEPRQGLGNARARGFDAVRYELVSCVDDDNWVAPDWIVQVAHVMNEHPEVGACGGISELVCDDPPPSWFAPYQNYFAIGQIRQTGQYTDMLWGAGMTIRRSIWQQLRAASFEPLACSAGEDQELSLLIRLAGWKLWIDPALKVKHYMPAKRLNWAYFRRLQRQRAADLVAVDPYRVALDHLTSGRNLLARDLWWWNVSHIVRCLLQNVILRPHKVFGRDLARYDGDADIFRIESYIGRLQGLIRNRRIYDKTTAAIINTNWQSIAGPSSVGIADNAPQPQ